MLLTYAIVLRHLIVRQYLKCPYGSVTTVLRWYLNFSALFPAQPIRHDRKTGGTSPYSCPTMINMFLQAEQSWKSIHGALVGLVSGDQN